MKKLLRIFAVAVLGVGLSTGLAAAQSSIDTTGPNSSNVIDHENDVEVDVENDNEADVDYDNSQTAVSGPASSIGNTEGGDATTGDAENESAFSLDGSIDNSGSSGAFAGLGGGNDGEGSISTTGNSSTNVITFDNEVDVDVENDNDVDVDVTNTQSAVSGPATVSGNTEGGSATTGDARNTSTSEVKFSISN